MSYEEMQQIAGRMTAQGLLFDIPAYYEALARYLEESADGSSSKLEVVTQKYESMFQLDPEGYMRPTWRLVSLGTRTSSGAPWDWRASRPPVRHLPHPLFGAIRDAWRVMTFQGDLYCLVQLAENQEWADHYNAGGDLWDLVGEVMGSGPITQAQKGRFFQMACNPDACRTAFPWLADAIQSFAGDPQPRTLLGTPLEEDPRRSGRNVLYLAAHRSHEEFLRTAILSAFRKTNVAPLLIHCDGVATNQESMTDYAEAVTQTGLRVVMAHNNSGVSSPPRGREDFNRPAPPRKSRFDFINEF